MNTVILGAGFSGLAASITSGGTAYEARDVPGGLGATYEKNGYKFEVAGGHWLFGGDPSIIGYIQTLTPCKRYERKASVYFPSEDKFYPYPIQQHPEFESEIYKSRNVLSVVTMKDWHHSTFGGILCAKFFDPFNESYTAGLYSQVAKQDGYKSPQHSKGYNVSFLYPKEGLGVLARKMAAKCNVRFGKRAQSIDVKAKRVHFADGGEIDYDRLISTLPLNRVMEMTGLDAGKPDPYVSVLVLNIGATKGPNCPDSHWVYFNKTQSGMHRLGVYSNVDPMFASEGKVAIYVETSFTGGVKPLPEWTNKYQDRVVGELQSWGWIDQVEVVDPTFVDVAYTYRNIGSTWREDALALLEDYQITSCGRFGAWRFQGIMESIKEGFEAGHSV